MAIEVVDIEPNRISLSMSTKARWKIVVSGYTRDLVSPHTLIFLSENLCEIEGSFYTIAPVIGFERKLGRVVS